MGLRQENPNSFPDTRWSIVFRLRSPTDDGRQQAFSELCQIYWQPLYTYARWSGKSPHDAEDLTQGFLFQLLSRGDLGPLNPEKGRLRSFLKASFKNFITDEVRRESRLKRGGPELIQTLDFAASERQAQRLMRDTQTPEEAFDRHWANTVLCRAMEGLRQKYSARGRTHIFKELEIFLGDDGAAPAYAEVAIRLGYTQNAVAAAVHRMRAEFRELLRREISDTLAEPLTWEDELRYLLRAAA